MLGLEPQFACTLAYRYSVPELNGFLARCGQFLDTLGVGLDPGIIWEAIPFSFVVDWFVRVGDWLHSHRIDNYPATVHIDDFCKSVKYSIQRQTSFRAYPLDGSGYVHNVTESLVAYDRRVSVPVNYELIDTRGWNTRKVLLSASLIAQELTQRRRR